MNINTFISGIFFVLVIQELMVLESLRYKLKHTKDEKRTIKWGVAKTFVYFITLFLLLYLGK
jgi:polyferredoxin